MADTPETLALAHCSPRKGDKDRLDSARVSALLEALSGWTLEDGGKAITRTFKFKDYFHTMSFVNALAHVANREDHHPDLGVFYDHCDVRYSTHDVGGLSDNDFICAAKADGLAD